MGLLGVFSVVSLLLTNQISSSATEVLHLNFDEAFGAKVFADASANKLSGSCGGVGLPACPLAGSLGFGNTELGALRRSLQLDGKSCIDFGNPSALNLKLPITISFWMYMGEMPTDPSNSVTILSRYNDVSQISYQLAINSQTKQFFFRLSANGKASSRILMPSQTLLDASKLNRWVHIGFEANADGTAYWFFDGAKEKTPSTFSVSTLFAGSSHFRLGCVEKTGLAAGSFFKGKIDQLIITHTENSDAFIKSQFQNGQDQLQNIEQGVFGNPPRDASNKIQVDQLLSRMVSTNSSEALGADYFAFQNSENQDTDLDSLKEMIGDIQERKSSLKLWYDLKISDGYLYPHGPNAIDWMTEISNLSKSGEITGFNLDDFFADRIRQASTPTGIQPIKESYFLGHGPYKARESSTGREKLEPGYDNGGDPKKYLKELCSIRKAINPQMKMAATVYCGYGLSASPQAFLKATTQDQAFIELINGDAELKACFTDVFVFQAIPTIDQVSRSAADPAQAIADSMKSCTDNLQSKTNLRVHQGVYISNLSQRALGLDLRKANLASTKNIFASGRAIWFAPLWSNYESAIEDRAALACEGVAGPKYTPRNKDLYHMASCTPNYTRVRQADIDDQNSSTRGDLFTQIRMMMKSGWQSMRWI